jgi:hypothetical protein
LPRSIGLIENLPRPTVEPETDSIIRRIVHDESGWSPEGRQGAVALADDAALWAHRSLGQKNRLTEPDAQRVEEAFQGRLSAFALNAAEVPPKTKAA